MWRLNFTVGGIVMGKGFPFGFRTPDRTERNESDGRTFHGYDNDNGTTDWYDKDGNLDSTSKTPRDDD